MDYCVYKHVNKINGKVYIGQTSDRKARWNNNGNRYKGCTYFYNAIQKYGWNNFEHIVLEDNLTQNEANIKERYYIKLYNSNDPDKGYNISLGGYSGGQPKGALNPLNKKIICLETKKIYPSARIAGQELHIDESSIRKACRGERASAGGLHWENYDENKNYDNIVVKKAKNLGIARKIQCIETQEIFSSYVEAAKKMNCSRERISKCCRGMQKSVKGFHFRYIEQEVK